MGDLPILYQQNCVPPGPHSWPRRLIFFLCNNSKAPGPHSWPRMQEAQIFCDKKLRSSWFTTCYVSLRARPRLWKNTLGYIKCGNSWSTLMAQEAQAQYHFNKLILSAKMQHTEIFDPTLCLAKMGKYYRLCKKFLLVLFCNELYSYNLLLVIYLKILCFDLFNSIKYLDDYVTVP